MHNRRVVSRPWHPIIRRSPDGDYLPCWASLLLLLGLSRPPPMIPRCAVGEAKGSATRGPVPGAMEAPLPGGPREGLHLRVSTRAIIRYLRERGICAEARLGGKLSNRVILHPSFCRIYRTCTSRHRRLWLCRLCWLVRLLSTRREKHREVVWVAFKCLTLSSRALAPN